MNYFIQQLVDDLKAFSVELLDPGLHTGQQISAGLGTVASTAALLKSIDFLTGLVPKLVNELRTTDATRKVNVHYTPVPKYGTFSPRASDYQQDTQKRLLPARWLTTVPIAELDIRPLRWLLYLLELQQSALKNLETRTNKYIDNSLLSQKGDSAYAQNDRATLLSMRSRLTEAEVKLTSAATLLLRTVQIRFMPSPNLPAPYPRSASWLHLRRYAQQLLDPSEFLPGFLYNLLNGVVEMADTPYLYQRWCGVKLLQIFESLGWRCYDDPVGALFLGGEIRLIKADVSISLWVEPRFAKRTPHRSGFINRTALELHPDYMIVTPGPTGVDAFILDPTTTTNYEIRHSKSRYLNSLEAMGMAKVAGNPVVRNPLRAWSASPMHTPHCELDDSEGRTGTVPMHPLDWSEIPLKAWVKDINDYALAWGRLNGLSA
ncbi:hypothetical protein BegalDRAFT_0101 [Beggiatoa alba B18LD]|uniref:Uncharacterized protein n=1 Tax=Beggiatoa alba B18LD TaxID=395493 RepID=I3CBN2_9GAMM|nr:hypothetical protein [Beggiatoa alba]EIJ41025.1 hypothetical protein BegalDRAFT_0101 [Beggiatoa alba B18LD]